jgi:hypothetical protein
MKDYNVTRSLGKSKFNLNPLRVNKKFSMRGWFGESHRHSLAALGVKTGRKYNACKRKYMQEKISIDVIRQKNRQAGMYWFEPSTMRFFNSHISDTAWKKGDKAYFISSEQFDPLNYPEVPRKFSVRVADLDTGEVGTVGEFQGFDTRSDAKKKIMELIKNNNHMAEKEFITLDELRRRQASFGGPFPKRPKASIFAPVKRVGMGLGRGIAGRFGRIKRRIEVKKALHEPSDTIPPVGMAIIRERTIGDMDWDTAMRLKKQRDFERKKLLEAE